MTEMLHGARIPEKLKLHAIGAMRPGMIQTVANTGTEDSFNGKNTRAARRPCPAILWPLARRKLEFPDAAVTLEDRRVSPGIR